MGVSGGVIAVAEESIVTCLESSAVHLFKAEPGISLREAYSLTVDRYDGNSRRGKE